MPDFELPDAGPELLEVFQLLDVRFDADLPPERCDVARGLIGGKKSGHAEFRRQCEFGNTSAELSAIIGVHLDNTRSDQQDDFYVHGHVRVQRRVPLPDQSPDDRKWEAFVSLLRELMGESPAAVTLRLTLPLEGTVTAVQLPIAFAHGEVSGFEEIRGVQLAQPDPEDAKKSLYSVILQREESSLSVDVQMSVALQLDSRVLVEAFPKAMAVARLAVPSIEIQ